MKTALKNRIIIVLSALLVFSVLSFAFTKARYSEEKNPDNHLGELDYTIANQIIVHNTEQFFAAIENGYSNIKLADTVNNPFLVSGAADVKSDLILDLNGHQIQRNSREPMLTVKEGVRMIVADTSRLQTGSFYNPVGSVLKIEGGVLTVMSNTFESGPRDDEYYKNRNKTEETDGLQYIGGTVSQGAEIDVSFKKKTGDTNEYEVIKTADTPILLPYVKEAQQGALSGGKMYFVNGNIYFDSLPSEATYSAELIKEDTYFYFTIDDKNASTTGLAASTADADFHYSYYVERTGTNYTYVGPSETDAAKDIKVTIYGYHNVIASARNEVEPYKTTPSNFAAIKMLSGSMYSRGGMFYSYFGVESSSCIYADEGTLFVYGGSYTALDEGVAVKCNYLKPESEFTIIGGNFKSYKGDIIQMTNGEMTITGGTFVKDASSYTDGNAGSNNNNSAIQLIKGTMYLNSAEGTPINFYLAGHYMAAIECGKDAQIDSTGVNYQFGTTDGTDSVSGGNNIGILSEGGNVNVENCTFIQPGNYSYGIYSYDKTDSTTHHTLDVVSSIFSMGGEHCTGIYADGGTINIGCESDLYKPDRDSTVYSPDGSVKIHTKYENGTVVKDENGQDVKEQAKGISIDNYTMFYLDHVANCYGVYVEKDVAEASTFAVDTKINIYSAQFAVGCGYADINSEGSNDNDKMYAAYEKPGEQRPGGGDDYVAYDGNTTIDVDTLQKDEKVWSAGVYLDDPTATVSLGRVRMVLGGSYTAGIFAEQGNVTKLYDEAIDIRYNGTPMDANDLPTTVLFVGTGMIGYKNGGYLNKDATEKSKRWNYLYKRDNDYYQTSEFGSYYDRILNCNSTDDYGIAAKAGSVTMGRIYINIRSQYSRGIFATSNGSTVSSVKLEDLIANIDNREENSAGEYVVVPKALNTTTMTIRNGMVEIDDGDVRTNGVGIVINNGQLTLTGTVDFQAINASAFYMTSTAMVSGGTTGSSNNLTIDENADVSIFCNVRERSTDLTAPIPWKLKNVHNRIDDETQIPSATADSNTNPYYMISNNGINVKGGSVTCDGKLTIDFHGVNNKNQDSYDPYNIPLSGCAINVEKLTDIDAPTVKMWHVHVTSGKDAASYAEGDKFYNNKNDVSSSNAGGGISVKGGNVYLGRKDDTLYINPANKEYQVLHNEHDGDYNELITIETFGHKRYTNLLGSYTNWNYRVSETGGPGIKVESGDIIVRHGTYYASQGNGILLVGGEATVYDGVFKGKNTEWVVSEDESTGSGLGSYYGFMLRGGGTLTIHNGTFEGFNGGAFVTGHKIAGANSESDIINMAVAKVYGGTFEDMPERRNERKTTNGFSVGPYSNVTIGKENPTASDVAPKIQGIACGIAVENNDSFKVGVAGENNYGFKDVKITVQGGTVVRAEQSEKRSDNINAIWKGNTSATLTLGECTFLLKRNDGNGDTMISSVTSAWSTLLDKNGSYEITLYQANGTSRNIGLNEGVNNCWGHRLEIRKKAAQTA